MEGRDEAEMGIDRSTAWAHGSPMLRVDAGGVESARARSSDPAGSVGANLPISAQIGYSSSYHSLHRLGRTRSGRASGSSRRAPSPRRPCRGLGGACHPWGHGWRHGWRSPGIGRDTAPAAGRPRTQGAALLTGWPRSRETAPLGVRRMQMMRHDDRQRSDWLGVRRASSADRRAGRGKVHEARIAVDFSESPAEDGDSG